MKENAKWDQPYVRRRLVYGVALVVVAVGTGFGLLTDAQASQAETWLPTVLAALGGLGAGGTALANTHRGSDSTATGDDILRAEERVPNVPQIAEMLAPSVRAEVEKAIATASGAVYGRHDLSRAAADTESDSYPSGDDAPSAYPAG